MLLGMSSSVMSFCNRNCAGDTLLVAVAMTGAFGVAASASSRFFC
jgi:hypothetical protein